MNIRMHGVASHLPKVPAIAVVVAMVVAAAMVVVVAAAMVAAVTEEEADMEVEAIMVVEVTLEALGMEAEADIITEEAVVAILLTGIPPTAGRLMVAHHMEEDHLMVGERSIIDSLIFLKYGHGRRCQQGVCSEYTGWLQSLIHACLSSCGLNVSCYACLTTEKLFNPVLLHDVTAQK
mmetsp:Transcript_70700/g.129002  ORF Transcript_70700/g.129002 Transcript_70700/m.129002 type:complete len:178 (-) Transcript_70700:11-544(-)